MGKKIPRARKNEQYYVYLDPELNRRFAEFMDEGEVSAMTMARVRCSDGVERNLWMCQSKEDAQKVWSNKQDWDMRIFHRASKNAQIRDITAFVTHYFNKGTSRRSTSTTKKATSVKEATRGRARTGHKNDVGVP